MPINDFSLIFKDVVEIDPGNITVKLLNLSFRLGEGKAAFVSHGLVVFLRLLQSIQIVVLNISPAKLVRNLVKLNMLALCLKVLNL